MPTELYRAKETTEHRIPRRSTHTEWVQKRIIPALIERVHFGPPNNDVTIVYVTAFPNSSVLKSLDRPISGIRGGGTSVKNAEASVRAQIVMRLTFGSTEFSPYFVLKPR